MLRVAKIIPFVLAALLFAAPRACRSFPIPTHDLDSLCFLSTDIVEASLIRYHQPGEQEWQDMFAATVVNSLAGSYRPGDHVPALKLEYFYPARTGQHCILFITRTKTLAPRTIDLLLIDKNSRVRRYFQWGNPGGLLAEGYSPIGFSGFEVRMNLDIGSAKQSYPMLAEERNVIVSKWAVVDRLRPLLSHDAKREDVSVLLNLLRERLNHHDHQAGSQTLEDSIADVVCRRLADLRDPSIALDALSLKPDDRLTWVSGLGTEPFSTAQSIVYVKSVLRDPHESAVRRAAAAKVLQIHSASEPHSPR